MAHMSQCQNHGRLLGDMSARVGTERAVDTDSGRSRVAKTSNIAWRGNPADLHEAYTNVTDHASDAVAEHGPLDHQTG